ncbi:MAG: RNA-binding protein [Candidatus Aenigmarchaeota archaeon]|nr:RNA-binding protein [Candidatus Aenigmarchaeota archaeon]
MAEKIKVPFGIIEGGRLDEQFSKDPKKAAGEFLSSPCRTAPTSPEAEKLFPYENYPLWLNAFGLELARLKLESGDGEEEKLILLARTYDEMTHFSKVLKNREKILKNYESYEALSKTTEKMRDKIEKKIRTLAEKAAPNTSGLLGPILSARIISKANGLERLSKMPVSKIQVLGAEKSLFRYLKEKEEGKESKNPKYGVIYMSPFIINAPQKSRGKVARALASKIMVASRIDYFSGEDRSRKIKEEFREEYEKICREGGKKE